MESTPSGFQASVKKSLRPPLSWHAEIEEISAARLLSEKKPGFKRMDERPHFPADAEGRTANQMPLQLGLSPASRSVRRIFEVSHLLCLMFERPTAKVLQHSAFFWPQARAFENFEPDSNLLFAFDFSKHALSACFIAIFTHTGSTRGSCMYLPSKRKDQEWLSLVFTVGNSQNLSDPKAKISESRFRLEGPNCLGFNSNFVPQRLVPASRSSEIAKPGQICINGKL